MRVLQLVILILLFSCRGTSELAEYSSEEILMTIENTPVTAGEFIYSFQKSHQNEDSISAASIDEYLQLFINYKLKVLEARNSGYDTAEAYLAELEEYQEQLKSSYRATEGIIDQLKQEAYERMQQEVNVSHILIQLPENASPEDTLEAYKKIIDIRKQALEGDFAKLAEQYSEDPSAKQNKGNLSYFTAFRMIYPFENAAYQTPVGQISQPVKTEYGYHILKVHDKRPVRDKIKLYQVQLNAKTEEGKDALGGKIIEIQQMFKNGLHPDQVAESIDTTRFILKKGLTPPLTLSQISEEIRKAVEQLSSPGDVSDPIKTDFGWHIFILEEKVPLPSYQELQSQLERMVKRSGRVFLQEEQMMDELKEKYNLVQHTTKSEIINTVRNNREDEIIFTIGEQDYTLAHFLSSLEVKGIEANDSTEIVKAYSDFIDKSILNTEDQNLIASNDELRWLLKEYEEGMLLFNIMEDSIWNKAVNDKDGLEKYKEEKASGAMISSDKSLSQSESGTIVNYQQFLEEQWIRRLRADYHVEVNQNTLKKIYIEILQY